MTAFNRSLMV